MSIANVTLGEYLQKEALIKEYVDSWFVGIYALVLCDPENKFPIDIEILPWQANGAGNSELIGYIRQMYISGVDFVETTDPERKCFLSGKCFKNIYISAHPKENDIIDACCLLMESMAEEYKCKKAAYISKEKLKQDKKIEAARLKQEKRLETTRLKLEKMTTSKDSSEYIYVMTIPIFKEKNLYKIGFTKDLDKRRKQLSNTSVPEEFVIEFSREVANGAYIEGLVHKRLNIFRVNKRREYFQCNLEFMCEMIEDIIADNTK